MDQVVDALNETVHAAENVTKTQTAELNFESALASLALFLMAIIPIYIGSKRSVKALKSSLEKENTETLEILSKEDAMKFPIYASIALLVPSCFPNLKYSLTLKESSPESEQTSSECFSFDFERKDAFPLIISLAHWISNNIIGVAIAITAIEYLHLDKVINGCILLSGLFFYDIFWVFATDVMVSVAKSFEAPIKVVFPRDILTGGFFSKELSMLGLGDIVIPGIFLALLLRFDCRLNRNGNRTYFWTSFFAYIVGLVATFAAMYIFKHAQPALLYLVPTCLGFPLTLALIKGDLGAMMTYTDIPEEIANKVKAAREAKKNSVKTE
ncbi:Minor histocompatibility antigen H13 [Sparganum proliferum]